jgi:hypothetical protein
VNFVFLSKTDWKEPPRVRHQLARLLARNGHEVHFLQRPRNEVSQRDIRGDVSQSEPGLWLYRGTDLIHHRLRLHPLLHAANAAVEKRSIRSIADHHGLIAPNTVVINFNYDYYFLRDVFGSQRIVTVINDDFVGTAPLGLRRAARWALRRTCALSDDVLVLSEPLRRMLSAWCSPVVMLPWSDSPYRMPPRSRLRNELLFWGYINSRLDLALVRKWMREAREIPRKLEFRFVGPNNPRSAIVRRLRALGARVEGPTQLEVCVGPRTLAAIMPYRESPANTCASMPNKGPALLAYGLPLVVAGMPEMLEAPFVIHPNRETCGFGAVAKWLVDNFDSVQASIRNFVRDNSAGTRLSQLSELLGTNLVAATSRHGVTGNGAE